ncbi:hypothetical protein ACX80W_12995 [Arthrobacter sp. TMN-37]
MYQDLAVIDTLNGMHNLYLSREIRSGVWPFRLLNQRKMKSGAREMLARIGNTTLSLIHGVGGMSGGQRAHSLMADPEKVAAMSQGEMKLQLIPQTGESLLVQDLPSEEVLESAAVRLRPLILNDDPVYWGKALKALGYLLKGQRQSGD